MTLPSACSRLGTLNLLRENQMNAAEFKLVNNELNYRTVILIEDEDCSVSDDGDDYYHTQRVVFRGWTDWKPMPKPEDNSIVLTKDVTLS